VINSPELIEVEMQRTGNSYEVIGTRNRLVTLVVILITLAIINSLASEFPRSEDYNAGAS
jgi:hypothetical protein